MESRSRAQDAMRCDVCKTAVVQMHCDTCLVNLCKTCVGEHMVSDNSKIHHVVNCQSRKSNPLYPECTMHTHERCEMYCNHCHIPICCACVASAKHSSHKINQLRQIYSSRRKEIQQDIENMATILPIYDGIVTDIQRKIESLEFKCKEIFESIKRQGEEWHKKIDEVVHKLQTELTEMKKALMEVLKSHKEAIERDILNINSYLKSSEEILQSNDLSLLFQYNGKISTLKEKNPPIDISLPSFSPKEIQQEQILKLFGAFVFYNSNMTKKRIEYAQCATAKQLLEKPEIITTINTGYFFLKNIACLNNAEIWASGDSRVIEPFSIGQESCLRSFYTDIQSVYITVSHNGDLVYCDACARTVNIVQDEKIQHTIMLHDWSPEGVCSTFAGDLLLIMYYDRETEDFLATKRDGKNLPIKVVRYSEFEEKQIIQFDEEEKPLYPCTCYYNKRYITENRNLDICVSDGEAVVVVNEAGKLRFRYTGHHPAPKSNHKFTPCGIITDSFSHILVADEMNKCIHIIDQHGQFIRFIDCGMVKPMGLSIDEDDHLFVADNKKQSGRIIKLRYLK